MQSRSPVVNVLLVGMDQKKQNLFNMAFKMHSTVRYVVVDGASGEEPQLAFVDVDSVEGISVWDNFKKQYPNLPAILTSVDEPDFPVPFLQKPIKMETLFPLIKLVMRGEGVFDPKAKQKERDMIEQSKKEHLNAKKKKEFSGEDQQFVVRKFQRKDQLPTASLQVFNPESGLLGVLRDVCRQGKDAALVYQKQPLLVVFPAIQKILLAVPPEKLKLVCEEDNADVTIKYIDDNPAWRKSAKVSFESCLWQFAIWSGRGRLVSAVSPSTMIRLKGWPNLTRLARITDSMRLSAFMTQTTANLHILYKILRIDLTDLLDFISATYMVGLLEVSASANEQQGATAKSLGMSMGEAQGNGLQEDGIVVRQKYHSQSTGMLKRLMSRLTAKEE